MSDNGMTWESPPTGAYKQVWLTKLDELQRHPGEWALVHEQADDQTENQARMTRNSIMLAAMRRGVVVEAVGRKVDGKVKVYARVVV